MGEHFSIDVFLSHSVKDREVARRVAERLQSGGMNVWFEGNHESVEDILEQSRVLLLLLSVDAFGDEWPRLEATTLRFRDPQNPNRRFLPIRLDDVPMKASLSNLHFLDWSELLNGKLLEACRPPKPRYNFDLKEPRLELCTKIMSLGHSEPIRSVAVSPDGRMALSGSMDKIVRVWTLESVQSARVLEGHSESVESVAWSPDGRFALSGSLDTTLRIWEIATGLAVRVVEGHSKSVRSVAWSPDGRFVLSGSDDTTVRIWDVETGEPISVPKGHPAEVGSVAWSSDGRRVLSGGQDKTVRVWDLRTGLLLHELHGHGGGVRSVACSPDSSLAISGSDDGTLRIWDLETGRSVNVLQHPSFVWGVAFSPDGSRALSGCQDKMVRVWDVRTGLLLHALHGHSAGVWSVAWCPQDRLAVSGSDDKTLRIWDIETGKQIASPAAHSGRISSVAWSPDNRFAISGAADHNVWMWDMQTGLPLRKLSGHTETVWSVAWSPNGRFAVSGSFDGTVRVWEMQSGKVVNILKGHTGSVFCLAWSPDGRLALSGSEDSSLRIWTGSSLRSPANVQPDSRVAVTESVDYARFRDEGHTRVVDVMIGHTRSVLSVAWSPDGRFALSGSLDCTLRIWDVERGLLVRILEGHTGSVLTVAWSPDGRLILSGSLDNTVRIWEAETGRELRVLEGHSRRVRSVAWSPDGRQVISGSEDNTVRVWEVETGNLARVLEGHLEGIRSVGWNSNGSLIFSASMNGVIRTWNLALPVALEREPTNCEEIQYTNAKVLLVGDSTAGKTGLFMRLALNSWKPSDSTAGAWATQWKLSDPPTDAADDDRLEREIWLWDFGGQADQRLIHQLYMEHTALAVLVFDGQKPEVFETLGQWDRELNRASRAPFTRLLATGRADVCGLRVSKEDLATFAAERGFHSTVFETSAKTGVGCEELKRAIVDAIDWNKIAWRTSPLLFKWLKEAILQFKGEGRVLMRFNELRDALRLRLSGKGTEFRDDQLKAVVSLLTGPGILWELDFGSWVLLEPERINAYAQAVIQTIRAEEHNRGYLLEERVLRGDLNYGSMQRLGTDEERFVLLAMHQTLVERGLCLREHTDNGTLLIFPSFYRRERPELVEQPAVLLSYRFNGFLDDIYSTLVVRLHHTKSFHQDTLWRYAADFTTLTKRKLGIKLNRRAEGAGELEIYFDPTIPIEEKIIFIRYVHEHLHEKAQAIRRLRHYVCPHCGTPVGNREVALRKLQEWLDGKPSKRSGAPSIICVDCEDRVPLWDRLEELFGSAETQIRVRELQEESAIVLDNESKERALVGDVISTVALAGQIAREKSVSDHGIDMEIEFKDDRGEATGKKLYLQLKSGDSYVKRRKKDNVEIFTIREQRHVHYWMAQAFPVLLVIRNSDGEVRWMEVRDWLKRATANGQNPINQIVFDGERFNVMSLRRWRDALLDPSRRRL